METTIVNVSLEQLQILTLIAGLLMGGIIGYSICNMSK